jgi:hypothetical protein
MVECLCCEYKFVGEAAYIDESIEVKDSVETIVPCGALPTPPRLKLGHSMF